jgi:hypothetical protein
MADVLILEFSAPDATHLYEQVNKLIGLDPVSGSGSWPEGMISHLAGGEGNHLVVVEEWESRAAQDEFMHARLQPAFADAQVPPPARIAWLPTVGSWGR